MAAEHSKRKPKQTPSLQLRTAHNGGHGPFPCQPLGPCYTLGGNRSGSTKRCSATIWGQSCLQWGTRTMLQFSSLILFYFFFPPPFDFFFKSHLLLWEGCFSLTLQMVRHLFLIRSVMYSWPTSSHLSPSPAICPHPDAALQAAFASPEGCWGWGFSLLTPGLCNNALQHGAEGKGRDNLHVECRNMRIIIFKKLL